MGKTFKRNNTEYGFRKFRNDKNFKRSKKFKHIHDEHVQLNRDFENDNQYEQNGVDENNK